MQDIVKDTALREESSHLLQSITEQRETLGSLLEKVSPRRPLIILLDGLDQVADHSARGFDWLPDQLPQHVKLVLTVRDGSREFDELKVDRLFLF